MASINCDLDPGGEQRASRRAQNFFAGGSRSCGGDPRDHRDGGRRERATANRWSLLLGL